MTQTHRRRLQMRFVYMCSIAGCVGNLALCVDGTEATSLYCHYAGNLHRQTDIQNEIEPAASLAWILGEDIFGFELANLGNNMLPVAAIGLGCVFWGLWEGYFTRTMTSGLVPS